MSDLEVALRSRMAAFAGETEAVLVAPSVAAIELRARAGRVPRRRRSRRAVLLAAGAMVVATGSAAAGVIPNPVDLILSEIRSWGFDPAGGGELMASVTVGDMTYEVWNAPLESGGRCVFERVIRSGTDVDRGGAASCVDAAASPRSSDRFTELFFPERVFDNSTGLDPESQWRHSVAIGQLPLGATEVVFGFGDGSSLTVEPQVDGFFVTTFPGIANGVEVVTIEALDAGGRVVARGR